MTAVTSGSAPSRHETAWSWQDGATPHNVTSAGRTKFRSSATKQSGKYSVTFAKTGTYHYECTIHPGMTGVVVVK